MCQQCGVSLQNGICFHCTYGDGQPLTCCECEGPLRGRFWLFCNFRAENSFTYDPNPYSLHDTSNVFTYPPQPQNKTYLCELCGNNLHYGYDCPPEFLLVYEQEPSYNQNDNDNYYPHNSPSFLCCDNCGGPYVTFQCQPMNQNINSSGFNQIQPPQYPNRSTFYNDDDEYSIRYKEYLENSSNAIAPILPIENPDNSLSMGDEHLSTIPEIESDEEIKSSVEDLVPILSDPKGISDDTCDVPFCDNSPSLDDIDYVEASPPDSKLVSLEEVKNDILCEKLLNINLFIACDLPLSDDFSHVNSFEEKSMTFSNPLFNSNDGFISTDDESLSNKDVLENIESKDFYDSNLDELDLLVTPFFDANKDECFDSGGDVDEINDFENGYYNLERDILYLESLLNDDLVHHDPSIPVMSVVSILEGFIDESPLKENDDLFDLESKNDE
nr:hypothetical protein [Tanacetum cinerariifolium]